jgi:hypothetical protein
MQTGPRSLKLNEQPQRNLLLEADKLRLARRVQLADRNSSRRYVPLLAKLRRQLVQLSRHLQTQETPPCLCPKASTD